MSLRGKKIVINSEDEDLLAEAGLTSIARVMKYRPGAVAAQSGSSEVFAVDLSPRADEPLPVFVTRDRYRGWRARVGSMVRGGWFGRGPGGRSPGRWAGRWWWLTETPARGR